jgi:hypothetical protein
LKGELILNYPRGVRFLCTRCTICCRDTPTRTRRILLLEGEAQRINTLTGQAVLAFAEPSQLEVRFPYEMKKADGCCIFLRENSCTIYEDRPLICRCYPFSLTKHENIYAFHPTDECPGMKDGEKLGRQFFEDLLKLALERVEQ